MEQLPRLQARIASLRELRDLFRALRALAAARVQEAHGALPGIRGFVGVVEDAIAEGAALLERADGPAFGAAPPHAGTLIVVCSEHGFVGAFNERLLDRAETEREPGQALVVIGRRGAALASERKLDVDRTFAMATHVGGVLGVTRRVAEYLAAIADARVVFAGDRRGAGYEIETRRILPLDPVLLAGSARRPPPLNHLPPVALLQRLASEYLFAEITRAVTESLASENGARLVVMEAADRNIADKLAGLGRAEHALRQEAITTELLDVVTGTEAILGRPGL